jgi:hypothetical protein
VPTIALSRWMLRSALAEPLVWLLLLASGWLWVGLQSTSAYGVVSNWGSIAYGISQILFLTSAVTAAWAISAVGGQPWLMGELGAARRLVSQAILLIGASLAVQGMVLIPPLLVDASNIGWAQVALCGASMAVHWSALALVLLQLPLPQVSLPILLLALGWWLPSLFVPTSAVGWKLHRVLDVGSHTAAGSATWLAALVDRTGVVALFFMAWLLAADTPDASPGDPR